jgi:predicted RNase H-like HicB family nuclease
MSEFIVTVVIYRQGDAYVAHCLGVGVASEGVSEAEARENLREALQLFVDEPSAQDVIGPVAAAQLERLAVAAD